MNERIRELAREAGFYANPDVEKFEKFAELIVNHAIECVRDVLREEDSELTYTAASQVQKRIKEHFGVEDELVNQMTNKKYEFVAGDELKVNGRIVKRIRAVIAIPRYGVAVGDLGGYIESEFNLSHEGDAWVGGDARVFGAAQVCDNARVYGDAWACGW